MVADDSLCIVVSTVLEEQFYGGHCTLQDLHFQTKLASPRLPLISFASWMTG